MKTRHKIISVFSFAITLFLVGQYIYHKIPHYRYEEDIKTCYYNQSIINLFGKTLSIDTSTFPYVISSKETIPIEKSYNYYSCERPEGAVFCQSFSNALGTDIGENCYTKTKIKYYK